MSNFIQIDSSLISQYAYNDELWVLSLTFRSTGKTSHYQEVTPEIFDELLSANSFGKFCNERIFHKFVVVREEDLPPAEITGSSTPVRDLTSEEEDMLDVIAPPPTKEYIPVAVTEEPQLGDILPPDQVEALQPPPKKLDAVDKLAAECLLLANAPLQVVTANSYVAVQEEANTLKLRKKAFLAIVEPFVKIAYEAYTKMRDKRDDVVKPIDAAVVTRNNALNVYDKEQERLAAIAHQEAVRKAEEEAEKERQRISEELTLAAANDAYIAGDDAAAELLFETPIQAPQMPVYIPRYEPSTPKIEGNSKRPNWSGKVVNMEELILDIAAGIQKKRKGESNMGHAPITFVEPGQTAINQMAKSSQDNVKIPGIIFENNPVRSSRSK